MRRLRTRWSGLRGRPRPRLRPCQIESALPVDAAHQSAAGADVAVRRKSAPASGALRRRQRTGDCRSDAIAGQGVELQQPGRSGRVLGAGAGVPDRARRCDHREAHQPVRRGDRDDDSGGLPEGARVRSGFGIRRSNRHQSRGGWSCGRGDCKAVCGSHCRAGIFVRGAGALCREEESAAGGGASRRLRGRWSSTSRAGCCCRMPIPAA